MSVAKGAEKDRIADLRSENVYTNLEYKPLLEIVPPFPFPPTTDGPDELVEIVDEHSEKNIAAREPQKISPDVLEPSLASYSSSGAKAFFDD